MAVRDILIYPQRKAELLWEYDPVAGLNRRVRRLILDLKDTLLACSEGIGLAAPLDDLFTIRENERSVMVREPIVRVSARQFGDRQCGEKNS